MRPAIRHALRPLLAVALSSIALFGCDDTSWRIDEAETKNLSECITTPWPAKMNQNCVIKKVSGTDSEYLVCYYDTEDPHHSLERMCEPGKILTDSLPGSPGVLGQAPLPVVLRIDLATGANHEVDWNEWTKCREKTPELTRVDGKCWGEKSIERSKNDRSSGTIDSKPVQAAAPYINEAVVHGRGGPFVLMSRFGPTETSEGLFAPSVTSALGDLALEWRDPATMSRIGPAMRVKDSARKSSNAPVNYSSAWTWDQKYFLLKVDNRLFILKNPAPLTEPDTASNGQEQSKQTPIPSVPNAPKGKP